MRAAIYVRVSTEEQAQHGYSLPEQKQACRKRAVELGATEIQVYADEGVSGSLLDRPGLTSLREAIRNRQVDCLIVRDPDRLARKLSHQLLITEEFEKAGVRLEFLDFDWQDTPEGRLFYSVRGAIAEYEREKIRERTTLGKIQKARQGGIPLRFDIYGYSYDKDTKQVSILEEEANVVKNIFAWFVGEDMGANGIARRLNKIGVPTRRRRGVWHKQVIMQVLTNSAYMGAWQYRKRIWDGKSVRGMRPEDERIAVPVPAIIDVDTWVKAQEKVAEARRLWAGRGFQDYLLSGIISCADCGNTMNGIYSLWWGKKERRYTCAKHTEGFKNPGCRPRKLILASVLEDAVWEQVKMWLSDPEALMREVAEVQPQMETLQRELERIKKQLAEVYKGRENILTTLASGLVELDAQTTKILVDLKRRADRWEARQKEIEGSLAGEGMARGLEELNILAQDLLGRLDELSFEEKKTLVRLLVKQAIVSGRPVSRTREDSLEITITARLPQSGALAIISC